MLPSRGSSSAVGKIDWDVWRRDYRASSFEEQRRFYSEVWRAHPGQRHFNLGAVCRAVCETGARSVVELGGWDGELAATVLDLQSVESWVNVEICAEAAAVADARHPRLRAPVLSDWYWTERWEADLFVASHVIEHMTADQLALTVAATDARHLYLDAPLGEGPTDWAGYGGSHVLEIGWEGVDEICSGYELKWSLAPRGIASVWPLPQQRLYSRC